MKARLASNKPTSDICEEKLAARCSFVKYFWLHWLILEGILGNCSVSSG